MSRRKRLPRLRKKTMPLRIQQRMGMRRPMPLADDGSGVGTVPLDGPIHRLRAKSTFSLTATSDVASKEHLLATGASYEGALSPSKEEQLNQLLQQISLFEDGSPKDGRTAHHDAMLLLMGSPSRATKPQGPRFALTFLVAAL